MHERNAHGRSCRRMSRRNHFVLQMTFLTSEFRKRSQFTFGSTTSPKQESEMAKVISVFCSYRISGKLSAQCDMTVGGGDCHLASHFDTRWGESIKRWLPFGADQWLQGGFGEYSNGCGDPYLLSEKDQIVVKSYLLYVRQVRAVDEFRRRV